jgi:hypothetical protein
MQSAGLDLGRTKTTDIRDDVCAFMISRSVAILTPRMTTSVFSSASAFRRINWWCKIYDTLICAYLVKEVSEEKPFEVGLDPEDISARGVRASCITSVLNAGMPAAKLMEQTLHPS